jgi:23S rRNA pseudouridine2605 synthase
MEERLQKVLGRAGVASRRKAEELILEGRVTVNGRVVRELGTKVDPSLDEVAVDTIAIPRTQAAGEGPRTYLLLYKPKDVVCTVKDTHGRITVLDLVPPFPGKRLYPVGRLDEDSEGLVLLTNDGELTAKLTHPRYGVPKVYEVRVKGRFDQESAERLERGVWLSEGRTGRSRVFIEHTGRETSHVRVTLTEGRNREIRRAFAKLGFPVLSIRRMQIGPVVGRGLTAGQYRPLDAGEVAALQAVAAGEGSNRPLRRGRRRRDDGDAPERPRRRPGKPDPAQFQRERRRRDSGRDGRPGDRRGRHDRPQHGGRGRRSGPPTERRPGGEDRGWGGPRPGGKPGGGRPHGFGRGQGGGQGGRGPRGSGRGPGGGGPPRGRGRPGGGHGGGHGGHGGGRGRGGRGGDRGDRR